MITWLDHTIEPSTDCKVTVVTSDVTFGVVNAATGFKKLSMYTALTPSHQAFVMSSSLITHEDIETFEFEIDVLLTKYPYLADDKFVLIVDGDRAKWHAARAKFKNVTIIVCLYHMSENIKAHFGPMCKRSAKSKQSTASKEAATTEDGAIDENAALSPAKIDLESDCWIQCEACEKWRKVSQSFNSNDFLKQFTCVQNNWDSFNSCDIEEQECFAVTIDVGNTSTSTEECLDEDDPKGPASPTSFSTPTAAATSSNASTSIGGIFKGHGEINNITWNKMWKYLRTAPTIAHVRSRLNEVQMLFPGAKTYIKFLWDNVATWAACASEWQLTFGFQASSMQEGIFSALKSALRNKTLPAHLVPKFIREKMKTRLINRARKQIHVALGRSDRLQTIAEKTCKTLVHHVQIFMDDHSQVLFLEEYEASDVYSAQKLAFPQEVQQMMPTAAFRQSSHRRFQCLIDMLQQDTDLGENAKLPTFYYVTAIFNDAKSEDICCVFENGAFASTSPFYTHWGMPGKHFWALFRHGMIGFNVKHHCHPAHWKTFLHNLPVGDCESENSVFSSNKSMDSCVIQLCTATWDYAQVLTLPMWSAVGDGSTDPMYAIIMKSSVGSIANHHETKREIMRKSYYSLEPFLLENAEALTLFLENVELLKRMEREKRGKRSQDQAHAQITVLTASRVSKRAKSGSGRK
jgi:hypothetical protein